MSSPPPVNDDDVPSGLETDAQSPAAPADDAASADDESSRTDIAAREPAVAGEPADPCVGPPGGWDLPAFEDSDPVTLTDVLEPHAVVTGCEVDIETIRHFEPETRAEIVNYVEQKGGSTAGP